MSKIIKIGLSPDIEFMFVERKDKKQQIFIFDFHRVFLLFLELFMIKMFHSSISLLYQWNNPLISINTQKSSPNYWKLDFYLLLLSLFTFSLLTISIFFLLLSKNNNISWLITELSSPNGGRQNSRPSNFRQLAPSLIIVLITSATSSFRGPRKFPSFSLILTCHCK